MARLLLTTTAVLQAVFGLVLLFAPGTVLDALGLPATAALLPQLLGGACLGFAALDGLARRSPAGGVYARPLVAGNAVALTVQALVLLDVVLEAPSPGRWAVFVVVALLAAGFALLLFGRIGTAA